MENMESERGGQTARQQLGTTHQQHRRRERREDAASLFGGYQGPERRSGRDRRASA
jgi:hypothetical protein